MEKKTIQKATLTIIVINTLIFIALHTIPNLADKLLLKPDLDVIIGRPWTLVTVFFSQERYVHILINMGLFFIFGKELEKITSSKTVFLIYITTGFIGSLTFIPIAHLVGWTEHVFGASAAVMGVIAAFAVMRPNTRILGSKAILFPGVLFTSNAILLILQPQISIGGGAHAIGIVVGLVCGYLLKKKELKVHKF